MRQALLQCSIFALKYAAHRRTNMFTKIKDWFGRTKNWLTMSEEERWLSQSADLADLERRLQILKTGGWNSHFRI